MLGRPLEGRQTEQANIARSRKITVCGAFAVMPSRAGSLFWSGQRKIFDMSYDWCVCVFVGLCALTALQGS